MITGERCDQQAGELFADCLTEPEDSGRVAVLDTVQPGAVLEDEGKPAARVFCGGGVHTPGIGGLGQRGDPSGE